MRPSSGHALAGPSQIASLRDRHRIKLTRTQAEAGSSRASVRPGRAPGECRHAGARTARGRKQVGTHDCPNRTLSRNAHHRAGLPRPGRFAEVSLGQDRTPSRGDRGRRSKSSRMRWCNGGVELVGVGVLRRVGWFASFPVLVAELGCLCEVVSPAGLDGPAECGAHGRS